MNTLNTFKRNIFIYIIIFIVLHIFYLFIYTGVLDADTKNIKNIEKEIGISINGSIKFLQTEENNTVKVYFFYSKDCKQCLNVLDKLNEIKQKDPKIEIISYELSEKTNTDIMIYLLDSYGYKSMNYEIPVVFLNDGYFIGKDNFFNNFEKKLSEIEKQPGKYNDKAGQIIETYIKETGKDDSGENYTRIPVVVASALADSVNPCAIGVIILLITSIIASKNRKYALIAGIIYISTIFVVYLILGLGFIYLTRSIRIPELFFIIMGSILIALGLFSMKDFFWYQKGPSLGIPGPIKGIIERNIYKATVASILLIGVMISIFEAACSGAVYLGILSLVSKSRINLNSLLILILYNLIFILPMVIILLVFYFGIPARKVQRLFISKNRRIYRLILGIILILLGVYLIIGL